MSWHYSRALVEEYLEASCSDGEQCVPSKSKTTPVGYLCSDKTTESSNLSRYGTTCELLTADHGEELLTWFRADFRVKTSVVPEKEKESPDRDPGFGQKWQESSAKLDPNMCSLKIVQTSELEVSKPYLRTLPFWGLMLNGVVYQRRNAKRIINGIASGLLPTPSANNYGTNQGGAAGRTGKVRPSLDTMARKNLWPTIKATDADRGGRGDLIQAVRGNENKHFKTWPTPRVHDSKKMSPTEMDRKSPCLAALQSPGQLNPTWVEWLMGWPIGWTDLKPLEMDKFQEWWQQHGGF